jgi:multicomponent K+:H+ antiporter subunit F
MLSFALGVAYVSIGVAIVLCTIRLLRGPDTADRILAFDTLYINTVALLIVLGIQMSTTIFYEAALLIALTGFIATVALARYLTRDDVMD